MDMTGRFQPTECFWSVQRSGETVRIPPYQQTQRTVYGQDRYILKSGRFYICNSGGTVGLLCTSSRLGMKVFFVFIGKPHPDSQIITHHIPKKEKGKEDYYG